MEGEWGMEGRREKEEVMVGKVGEQVDDVVAGVRVIGDEGMEVGVVR